MERWMDRQMKLKSSTIESATGRTTAREYDMNDPFTHFIPTMLHAESCSVLTAIHSIDHAPNHPFQSITLHYNRTALQCTPNCAPFQLFSISNALHFNSA